MNTDNPAPPVGPSPPSVHADHHGAASADPAHVADASGRAAALQTLNHGPRGAVALASTALGLVLLLWLLFYFFVFLPRGPIE